jgi:high-affinity K+ transport system ATPase subunit B
MITAVELKELCHNTQPSLAGPAMPSTSGTFKASEDANAVHVDAEDPTKIIQIGAGWSPK